MPSTNFPKGLSVTTAVHTVDGLITATSISLGTAPVGVIGVPYAITINFAGATTAAEAAYVPTPLAGNVSGKIQIASGAVGTGAAINCFVTDTAGAVLLTAALASASTAGVIAALANTSGTIGVTSAQGICVAKASCATAFGCGVTLFVTRSA